LNIYFHKLFETPTKFRGYFVSLWLLPALYDCLHNTTCVVVENNVLNLPADNLHQGKQCVRHAFPWISCFAEQETKRVLRLLKEWNEVLQRDVVGKHPLGCVSIFVTDKVTG